MTIISLNPQKTIITSAQGLWRGKGNTEAGWVEWCVLIVLIVLLQLFVPYFHPSGMKMLGKSMMKRKTAMICGWCTFHLISSNGYLWQHFLQVNYLFEMWFFFVFCHNSELACHNYYTLRHQRKKPRNCPLGRPIYIILYLRKSTGKKNKTVLSKEC